MLNCTCYFNSPSSLHRAQPRQNLKTRNPKPETEQPHNLAGNWRMNACDLSMRKIYELLCNRYV